MDAKVILIGYYSQEFDNRVRGGNRALVFPEKYLKSTPAKRLSKIKQEVIRYMITEMNLGSPGVAPVDIDLVLRIPDRYWRSFLGLIKKRVYENSGVLSYSYNRLYISCNSKNIDLQELLSSIKVVTGEIVKVIRSSSREYSKYYLTSESVVSSLMEGEFINLKSPMRFSIIRKAIRYGNKSMLDSHWFYGVPSFGIEKEARRLIEEFPKHKLEYNRLDLYDQILYTLEILNEVYKVSGMFGVKDVIDRLEIGYMKNLSDIVNCGIEGHHKLLRLYKVFPADLVKYFLDFRCKGDPAPGFSPEYSPRRAISRLDRGIFSSDKVRALRFKEAYKSFMFIQTALTYGNSGRIISTIDRLLLTGPVLGELDRCIRRDLRFTGEERYQYNFPSPGESWSGEVTDDLIPVVVNSGKVYKRPGERNPRFYWSKKEKSLYIPELGHSFPCRPGIENGTRVSELGYIVRSGRSVKDEIRSAIRFYHGSYIPEGLEFNIIHSLDEIWFTCIKKKLGTSESPILPENSQG